MMLTKKAAVNLAKKLASLSFDKEGKVDVQRVSAVLEVISEYSEKERCELKKKYWYFLDQIAKQRKLIVEAGERDFDAEPFRLRYEKKFRYPVCLEVKYNPNLIAGFRMKIGDIVWEKSLFSDLDSMRDLH